MRDQLKDVHQIQATESAFAAFRRDGAVVTWDDASSGDSSAVQDQLKNVRQIQATSHAFAAILADKSVATWGHRDSGGGDSSAVHGQLKNVQQMQATKAAFAAVRGDGSVVTWGDACLELEPVQVDLPPIPAASERLGFDHIRLMWEFPKIGDPNIVP